MVFDEYMEEAMNTAIFADAGDDLFYPTLGLAGEAGEVAGKIKKLWRDHHVRTGNALTEEQAEALGAELGDVLWYLAVLAHTAGLSLDTIATNNLSKLKSRQARGVLQGSGDVR
jgi:NTP pyrophosphatase (non-canonical NTP hydrolase)